MTVVAAAASARRIIAVPEPLASRLDALVAAGEFESFVDAAVAMIVLGIATHDQRGARTVPGVGPSPPAPRTGPALPPPPSPTAPPSRGAEASGRDRDDGD